MQGGALTNSETPIKVFFFVSIKFHNSLFNCMYSIITFFLNSLIVCGKK